MADKFVQGNWLLPNNVNANKQSNYSLSFTGLGSSDYIISNDALITGNQSRSISVWAKSSQSLTSNDNQVPFSLGTGSIGNKTKFAIKIRGSQRVQIDAKSYNVDFTSSYAGANWGSVDLNDGQWHHYVVTYATNDLKLYVDGTFIAGSTNFNSLVTQDGVLIGVWYRNGVFADHFPGQIDEVSVFSRVLSSGEVSSLYNSGTPGNPFDLSGDPIAYYKLGETAIGQAPGGTWNWQIPNHAQSQLGWQGLPQGAWDGGTGGGGQNLGTTHTISYWINNNNYNNSSYNRAGWFGMTQSANVGGTQTSGNNLFQDRGIIYGRGGSSSADGNMPVAGNYITYRTGSNSSTNNMQFPLGSINLQDNQTYNIIFIRDGGSVKCFINGQELENPVGSINASFELVYQIISNTTTYGIQRGWGGIMTNVAIWKSDRESELDNIYNNGEPQSNYTTAPDIWYKFDDTTTSYPGQYKRAINSSLSSESYVKSYLKQPFYNGAQGGAYIAYIYSILDSDLNLGTSYSFSFWMGFRTDRENFYAIYNRTNVYYLGTNPSNTNVSGILEQDVYASGGNSGAGVNTVLFTLHDSNGNTATGLNLANSGTPSLNTAFDGQLHNYMFIKDGQTVSFYFDNQLVASSTMAGELSNTVLHNINGTNGGNFRARSNNTTTAEWSFFANKVLSSSERATIYNNGDPGDISSTSPTIWYSYDNIDVTNEKLLDKGSAGTNASILRRSGSNMNAGSSMSYIKYRDGVQSYTADLTSTDLGLHNPLYSQFSNSFDTTTYIDTNFAIPNWTKYAYSIWFKFNGSTISGYDHLIGNLSSGANVDGRAIIGFTGTNLYLNMGDGTNYWYSDNQSAAPLLDGNWHHIVLNVYETGQDIYVDGSLLRTYTYTGSVTTGTPATANNYINKGGSASSNNGVDSSVDEHAIFNRLLTATEISSIYNNGKPNDISYLSPSYWWRLGDSSYTNSSNYYVFPNKIANAPDGIGNAAYKPSISADAPKAIAPGVSSGLVELDKKGDAPNSTSNSISYNILKTDQSIYTPKYVSQYTVDNNHSMSFDGTNDYFSLNSINLGTTNTISFWYNGEAITYSAVLGSDDAPNDYTIWVDNNGTHIAYKVQAPNSTPVVNWNITSINDGNWHHLAFSRINTTINLYIDGNLQTVNSNSLVNNDTKIDTIGAKTDGSYPFKGELDEVAFFNKALTADQIKFEIYEASTTANKSADFINNPNLPDPVAWYRMGD